MKYSRIAIIFLAMLFYSGQAFASHDFTGLPVTSSGWTDFATMTSSGYESARVVFVADDGNDGTAQVYGVTDVTFDSNGMFQPVGAINAYATIATAYAQIRTGYPDILLLKRGDTWAAGLGGYVKSGVSKTVRHIIASYGAGDRPKLTGDTLDATGSSFIAVSGVRLYSADWTTEVDGLQVKGAGAEFLFEDVVIDGRDTSIVQGSSGFLQNVAFRRSIFRNGQAADGQIFAQQTTGFLFEECIFSEPYDRNNPDGTPFGRFFYLTSESTTPGNKDYLNGVIVRRNIFYRGEREGIDLRSGGVFDNNLILQNDSSQIGGRGGSEDTEQSATITNNIFSEGPPTIANTSNGLTLRNINGGTVSGNIWTDRTRVGLYAPIISIEGDNVVLFIAKNITISNNIVHRFDVDGEGPQLSTSETLQTVENVNITGNDFERTWANRVVIHRAYAGGTKKFEGFTYSNNNYYNPGAESLWMYGYASLAAWSAASGETGATGVQKTYPYPDRTVKTYNASLGGTASSDEFVAEVLLQSRHNWRPEYTALAVNNYIREGFLGPYHHGNLRTSGNLTPRTGNGWMRD